jgi:hypothetical protein
MPTQPPAVRKLVLSEFKLDDGVNWPRILGGRHPPT